MSHTWMHLGKQGWKRKAAPIFASFVLLLTVFAGPQTPPGGSEGDASDERPTPLLHNASEPTHPLLSYRFTNELGQAVSLEQFRGQALALTFFFTRCSNPDFCPRLSKNFQEACRRLLIRPGAPTNWHFLSVTIDPEFDSPAVLKAYGFLYEYNPAHWNFITGPKAKVQELARFSDAEFEPESGSLNHNFRTLVIDTRGQLRMVYPITGDFSASLADEVLKAALVPTEAR